jgi:hypothetical protein
MRQFILILTIIPLFHGCLYFNDTGISTKLYSEGDEYYDANGNYRIDCCDYQKCNKNIEEYKNLEHYQLYLEY